MNPRRFGWLALAALVVISAGLYLSGLRNPAQSPQGGPLWPTLAAELNSVTSVTLRKGSAQPTVNLHKRGTQWTVAERADYPADVAKLRKLLVSLRDTRIVEEKTADPARFAVIGVDDPAAPGATGAEITVMTPTGKYSVIVGKPIGGGNFVRRGGENRTYSVEPSISLETEPRFWIDQRVLDVPVAQIKSEDVRPASGAAYILRRSSGADATFALEGVPTGRKPLEAQALAPAPTTLSGLEAEDVSAVGDLDFSRPSQAIVTLTDGGIVTLTGMVNADKHWLQIQSSKDPVLSAKTAGRAFEVASYRYDAIFKPVEQLLVPKEPPVAHAAAAPHGAAGASSQMAKPPPAKP